MERRWRQRAQVLKGVSFGRERGRIFGDLQNGDGWTSTPVSGEDRERGGD